MFHGNNHQAISVVPTPSISPLVSSKRAFALTLPDHWSEGEPAVEVSAKPSFITKLNKQTRLFSRHSLRLIFPPFHIRFMAKSRAPFGSFCQSRLCSSARRLPQTRVVLASAPLPL